ncbi:MAG: hypothetical protein IKY83_12060 [Proteobacteria bacterium]|nr:hypothetical protein [Pseudomonadota bacterium]
MKHFCDTKAFYVLIAGLLAGQFAYGCSEEHQLLLDTDQVDITPDTDPEPEPGPDPEPEPDPYPDPEPDPDPGIYDPDQPQPDPGQPEPDPGQPEPDPGQPEPDPGQPEPDPGQPEPDPGQPEPDPGQPEPDPGQPEPDPGQPEPDPGQPEPDPGQPEPDPGECPPAKEGQSCNGPLHDCGVNVCRNGQCVTEAVTDGHICRESAGVCDIEERCDGQSVDCPADAKQPSSTVCRASAGVCDIEERCDGQTVDCPADAKQPSSTVCRASAGVCDKEEKCDGQSVNCPADAKQPSSTVCRASAGVCDKEEKCDGQSVNCPADAKQPTSTVCQKAAGKCDQDVKCDGSNAKCPAKVITVKNSCVCPMRKAGPTKASAVKSMDYSGFLLRSRYWTAYEEYTDLLKQSLKTVSVKNLNFNREMQVMTKDLAKKYTKTKETGQSDNYLMTNFGSWVGYKKGWFWNDGDVKTDKWIPQGMTVGSVDGFKFAIVSWHYTNNERVRISIVDTNDLSKAPKYRNILLVQPTKDGSYKNIPNHASGVALAWPYLYEADSSSSKGLRVFDMRNILKVDTSDACDNVLGKSGSKFCAYGYAYVLPQAGAYYSNADSINTNSECKISFSYLSYDEGEGPHILAGEYVKDEFHARLVRWPLADSGKLKTVKAKDGGEDITVAQPDAAWYAGERNLQGGVTAKVDGKLYFLLTATRNAGALNVTTTSSYGKLLLANKDQWSYRPEGIAVTGNQVWVATEGNENPRGIFYADLKTVVK